MFATAENSCARSAISTEFYRTCDDCDRCWNREIEFAARVDGEDECPICGGIVVLAGWDARPEP